MFWAHISEKSRPLNTEKDFQLADTMSSEGKSSLFGVHPSNVDEVFRNLLEPNLTKNLQETCEGKPGLQFGMKCY